MTEKERGKGRGGVGGGGIQALDNGACPSPS